MERAQEDQPEEERRAEKKGSIQIPSYEDVFGSSSGGGGVGPSSRSYNPPPTTSFSQAFSFIKSSEFYTPPPPMGPPKDQLPRTASDSASASCSSSYSAPPSKPSVISSSQNRNAILVSHRQKGNPLLKHIRNVKWAFADIVCDYLVGQSSCALYIRYRRMLECAPVNIPIEANHMIGADTSGEKVDDSSLRYHLLHPDYLYYRIKELQKNFKLHVILCHIDVEDAVKPLLEITRTSIFHDCTLLCGWSLEECGRYLETLKAYENKPADSIREQTNTDYLSRLTHALTTVRHVNKTDVVTLGSTFGSLSGIMDASMEDLARCPGIGERKVKRLHDTFHEPFRRASRRPDVTIPEAFDKAKRADKQQPSEDKGSEKPAIDEKTPGSPEALKESDSSIRSALDAALPIYAERISGSGSGSKHS
ncbi:DNA excision repair protein ERCC-1 [Platanthera zijinensis]|uniref:DNA excision repair protein ERCC-1 n=1 Tax=Platanthera zijinensis TaxID=2320716 RepID=A0AAP0C536_9ASPA